MIYTYKVAETLYNGVYYKLQTRQKDLSVVYANDQHIGEATKDGDTIIRKAFEMQFGKPAREIIPQMNQAIQEMK